MQFLKSSGSEQSEKQKALEGDLEELNKFLEDNGPYLGGEKVIAADLALSPRLYHIDVAAKALKVMRAGRFASSSKQCFADATIGSLLLWQPKGLLMQCLVHFVNLAYPSSFQPAI